MPKLKTALHLVVYLALSLAVLGPAPVRAAGRPQESYAGPGRYEIQNVRSGKLMEVDRKDRGVQQGRRTGEANQQWDIEDAGNGFVYITSAESGMVLDVEGGRRRDGARVIVSRRNESDGQLWEIKKGGEGVVRFTSRLGKGLDLPHGSRSDGVGFETWDEISQDNQRFRLVLLRAAPGGGPRDHRRDDPDDDDRNAYQFGYRLGLRDYQAQVRRSYARHKARFNAQSEEDFIEGYYDGYDAGRNDTSTLRREEKQSYDQGFREGQDDARAGRRPGRRDRAEADRDPFFRRGYADGFYSARPR